MNQLKLSKENFKKAKDFILVNARMIERRLFHYEFGNDHKEGVYHAVYAYRNSDGGFGHGMEPDTTSPESQPLFSIMALETLDEADILTPKMILKDFMPYFESVTTDKGGIPWMFKPTSDYPCAGHFKTVKEWAALSTTSALLGMLEKYQIEIPWMKKAEEFVWSEFDRIQDKHIFCYLCVPRWLRFLKYTRSQDKAQIRLDNMKHWILNNNVLCKDTSDEGWGLYEKPHSLNYAPSPDEILNPIFSKETINKDLNTIIRKQQDNGSWDTWYGISEGTRLEWAGIQTLYVLRILKNYDRIDL